MTEVRPFEQELIFVNCGQTCYSLYIASSGEHPFEQTHHPGNSMSGKREGKPISQRIEQERRGDKPMEAEPTRPVEQRAHSCIIAADLLRYDVRQALIIEIEKWLGKEFEDSIEKLLMRHVRDMLRIDMSP